VENRLSDDGAHRLHLETLLAADEGVEQIFRALEASQELDNTVFLFTTDNGFLWGEHAVAGKQMFYEESIRVPLIVFDGRTALAGSNEELVLNIDVAPTLAELAGVPLPRPVDGVSLVETLYTPGGRVRDDFLLEQHWSVLRRGSDTFEEGLGLGYFGLRGARWKYLEFESGHVALYDLQEDPFELENLAGRAEVDGIQQQLAARLQDLVPADQQGPEITSLGMAWETDAHGAPRMRFQGALSDSSTGGSPV
jgi:arylsulfatase A-like enzyme